MTDAQVEGTAAPPEEARKGFLARVIGVFFSPGETMEDIARKPTVIAPLLLLFLGFAALNVVIGPIAGPEQADLLENSSRMQAVPEAQRAEILENARNPSSARLYLGAVAASAAIFVAILLYSLILWGSGHLLGGEPKFKGVLSMLLFASLIAPLAATLLKLPLIIVKESVFQVTISPAIFMPSLEVTSGMYLFLSIFFDFFYIWGVIVGGIGLSKVARISAGAGIAVVAVLFLIRSGLLYFITALSFG